MRDLIIDMADFGGVASAGDEVVLSAPAVRGSSVDPGRLITPQPRALELVDGVVTVPVEVGPLQVTLKPQGGVLSGTTFKTVVPEGEGPITLRDCLESQFRYDPPVVNRGLDLIEGARDEALGQVAGAVGTEISEHLESKADKADLWHRGALGDRNLNVLSTSFPAGMWDQHIPELATLDRGYPLDGERGYLVMYTPTDSLLRGAQEYITTGIPQSRHFIRRWLTMDRWTSWEEQATLSAVTTALSGKSDEILGQVDTRITPLKEAVEGAASVEYVDAQIQSAIPDPVDATTVDPSAFDILAAKLDFRGLGQLHIGVVGDSTMNDGNEMPRVFARSYGALLPENVRRVYHAWKYSASTWSNVIDAEGEGAEGTDGRILEDNFSRTGEIIGSSPDYGPAWSGAEGVWSGTGAGAVASATGLMSADAGASTQALDVKFSLVTTATGVAQSHRLYAASPTQSLAGRIMAAVTISAAGYVSVAFYKVFGTSEVIATIVRGEDIGIAPNQAAPQEMSVKIDVDIQNIAFTITGPGGSVTRTATITEAESTSLGTWSGIYAWASSTPGFTVTRTSISTVPTPPSGNVLEMWNGAISGGRMSTFHADQRVGMFGDKHIDILILAMGHNHGAQSPEDFTTEIVDWVTAWREEHPETQAILWVSQNPKYPPAANIEAHLHRQAAMRQVAFSQGWTYTPACEAYLAQPDGGSSLVLVDGVHPSSQGAILMTDTLMAAVNVRTVPRPTS